MKVSASATPPPPPAHLQAPAPTTPQEIDAMPNVLLQGYIGSGKSHAIRTLLDAGLEVFLIKTEPSEVLDDTDPQRLHWRYIPAARVGWQQMLYHAKMINTMTYKGLANVEDIQKQKHNQFIKLLETCNNFHCDRTGRDFGDVMNFGHDKALVIDSLTGLSWMSKSLMSGSKPAPDRGEWGVAMDNIERFLNELVTGTQCLFVLTAHIEREPNDITGGSFLSVSTLGQKLGPKIPRFFSDVIWSRRQGTGFSWCTLSDNMELKARNLPWSDGLQPSFVPLIERWRQRRAEAIRIASASGSRGQA